VALPLFERAARIWEGFVRYNPAEIGFQIDLAAFYFASHVMQADEGRPAEALANVRKTYAIREKIARENPNVPEYRSELAWAHDFLADCLGQVGRAEEVEKHCRQSLELRKQLVEECPRVGEYRLALAVSHHNLGDCFRNTGQLPEAEQAYRRALILREKLVIEFPLYPACRGDLADGQYTLGHLLRLTGRLEKAAEAYGQAMALWEKLAADFPGIAGYREKVAHSSFYACLVLAATSRPQEAEQFYRKVVEFKPESPDAYSGLAWMLVSHPDSRFRDPSRAVEMAKKAVELGAHRTELWDYCNNLGIAHYRAGNWKDAIAALEKSMVLANGQGESANSFLLAMAHWRLGDKEQARKWYGRAVQWMEKNQLPREELRQELLRFRAEATELLGIKNQPTAKENEQPQQGPKP
jgi:tetratricopeptide (TPR) repeat protein